MAFLRHLPQYTPHTQHPLCKGKDTNTLSPPHRLDRCGSGRECGSSLLQDTQQVVYRFLLCPPIADRGTALRATVSLIVIRAPIEVPERDRRVDVSRFDSHRIPLLRYETVDRSHAAEQK